VVRYVVTHAPSIWSGANAAQRTRWPTSSRATLGLSYLIFQQVLGLVLLLGRTSSTNDIALLGLRHEVAILRLWVQKPRALSLMSRFTAECRGMIRQWR
jgi:hypothetical protein